jgi:CHAT domain-containing protein/Tfp pilus assembly protein PilF
MTQPLFVLQSKYHSWVVYSRVILSISLLLVQTQASTDPLLCTDKESKPGAGVVIASQENREIRQLELGKPIERELAGDQPHSYQIKLAAGQYAKLLVDQRGIDVVVKLSGPDRKQITEFDSEIGTQGQETVEWVTEGADNYWLDVGVKQKNAEMGRYMIQLVELRIATENDRTLHEARKLQIEFDRLYLAGKYDEASPLAERVLEIRERVLGPEHPDVSEALTNLARLYEKRAYYTKAEALYQRALTIWVKVLGPEHSKVAAPLNNLANLYMSEDEYAKAEQLYQHALTIREKVLGPEHPDVAATLTNLAALSTYTGDYAKAEAVYQRALTINEKMLGPEHPEVGANLVKLAVLYSVWGDNAKAEPLFQRALTIREKALGPEHPDVAATLSSLASLYLRRGDYAKAEPLFQRALLIREKALGPEHYEVGINLSNLAALYFKWGDYAKAEPLYRRALAIYEKALGGREHPYIAMALNNLAVFLAAKGDVAQAMTFLSRANAIDERDLALTHVIGSERQKLGYLSMYSKRTDFTLWLQSQMAPTDLEALNLAFTTLLRRKARGLDAVAEPIATLRHYGAPQDRALVDQLTGYRSQMSALTLKGPNASDPDAYGTRVKLLEDEIDQVEKKLSSRSAEFRKQSQPVTLAAVQAALPADTTLVEFATYAPIDSKTEKIHPSHYLVYLLAAQGEPQWVDLGEAAPIDRAVEDWRKALSNPNRIDVKQRARAVDERVMRPVRSRLHEMPGEARRLLIAPDGSLNLIPFAALVDEQDHYLIERYTISYLTSGRDLLRLQVSEPSRNAPLIMANPDFGGVASVTPRRAQMPRISRIRNQARGNIDPTRLFFRLLPGSQDEALAIKALLPNASVLLREQATETALKQARGPRILHIATHGFFIYDQVPSSAEMRGVDSGDALRIPDLGRGKWAADIKNPLLRSGLGLAGANQNKGGDDDGVLTALEVAGLDLSGTKLVVFSAGNSGVGEVKNGEGVQGLRRALAVAGSESQVLSLWPVSDIATKDLMISYYKALQSGDGRSEGLRHVQLQMLHGRKDRRHPFYWAGFIQSGEWASLDGIRQ